MRYTVLFLLFISILCGCKKDKYTSAPQLKYKSSNTKVLHQGETLQMTLLFTDAEGDLTDKIIIQKIVAPCRTANGSFIDSTNYLPSFPTGKNQSGDILITYSYSDLNPQCAKNDTAIFKFVLRDKAQHSSDTAVSPPIVIIY